MGLQGYRKKRRFDRTTEPRGEQQSPTSSALRFVVQKHDASRLHYDFRLELDGVLKSWAVPKGPSLDPGVKALAVHVEDHPLEYASFEGTIPAGEYGGGTVTVWDEGTWQPDGNPERDYAHGRLTFDLHGKKLNGRWTLVRMGGKAGEGGKNWLLMKADDAAAMRRGRAIVDRETKSVATGRTLTEIEQGEKPRRAAGTAESQRAGPSDNGSAQSADVREPGALVGARKAALPKTFEPQLAVLVKAAPQENDWIYELKFDGYRLIARKSGTRVQLLTRAGNDWTHRFPSLARAIAGLDAKSAILDGEVVVLTPDGSTNFQALQNVLKRGNDRDIVYYAFDLPYCDGYDLRKSPLSARKALLERLIQRSANGSTALRFSGHLEGHGAEVLTHACHRGAEGLVGKRSDAPYTAGRSSTWIKLKCEKRQEFVIGGWSDPSGARQGLGSLLLGIYAGDGTLRYCGRVGTGFNETTLADLRQRLNSLAADEPPFANPPTGRLASDVHWVDPKLVAEVSFAEWTSDGILRHSVFHGLREDKPPRSVTREVAVKIGGTAGNASKVKNAKQRVAPAHEPVRITNRDRVLYPDSGVTKGDVADYYSAVAEWILPHVAGRPLSIVRCPEGPNGSCFFQRHYTTGMPESTRGVPIEEKDGPETCLEIHDVEGLLSLVQMGSLEIHPWGSRVDNVDRPDRLIIDLDPGDGVAWTDLVRGAREVHDRLAEHGLTSFVRTTGGKGLHVVAPLSGRPDWELVKTFARGLALTLQREFPDRYISKATKAERRGKLFVDYLRNERGATAIASYSTRAREGATVATPIRWEELTAKLNPQTFTTSTVPARLSRIRRDPWEGFFTLKQTISRRAANDLAG